MQPMEIHDYINERPRRYQKGTRDANQTERRLCWLLFISFGILCIIQVTLNVALRLTLNSSKEQTGPDCNATHSRDDENQVTIVQDCERRMPCHCNKLQDRFNTLTGERDQLRNEKSDLTNKIRKLVEETDRLLRELSFCVSSKRCPPDWREINSRCYFLSTEQKAWEDSRKYCQSKGADLVVINSEEEQRALYRMDGNQDLLFWIGLHDTTGTFKWVDGSALTKTFWQSGQPGDGGPNKKEECVEMYHFNPVLANWNDAPCGHNRHWLCERAPCRSP